MGLPFLASKGLFDEAICGPEWIKESRLFDNVGDSVLDKEHSKNEGLEMDHVWHVQGIASIDGGH